MRNHPELLTPVTGRYAILALGGIYIALAGLFPLIQTGAAMPLDIVMVVSTLTGVPGAILVYGGYRLPQSNIHPALYGRVAGWCLAGAGVMGGILLLSALIASLTNVVVNVLILTALGSGAGFGMGVFDAKSRTRAREAEQRNRELTQQNARLENFAQMLAHELRNPLMIAMGHHELSHPQNEAAAQKVTRAHERIEEMIDIMLITIRGDTLSGTDTQSELQKLAPLVLEELPNMEAATLHVESTQAIHSDPVHLQHLLANLFRNSLEHNTGAVTVRVGDLDEGFYVEDTGTGIPETTHNDVVEAGFTTREHGTGLGLTVVTQIAELYNWDWSLSESESGGARFEFTNVKSVPT